MSVPEHVMTDLQERRNSVGGVTREEIKENLILGGKKDSTQLSLVITNTLYEGNLSGDIDCIVKTVEKGHATMVESKSPTPFTPSLTLQPARPTRLTFLVR